MNKDKEGLLLSKPAVGKTTEKLYFIKREGHHLESRYGKVGSKNVGVCSSAMKSIEYATDSYQEAIKTKLGKGYVKVKELSDDHKDWLALPITKKTKGTDALDGDKSDAETDSKKKTSKKDDGSDDETDKKAKKDKKEKKTDKPSKKADKAGDDDDDTKDTKAKCMYGMDCRRKNPTHFKDYTHPKGFVPVADSGDGNASDSDAPAKTPKKTKKTKKTKHDSGDDDDDAKPKKKKQKKTKKKNDSDADDDGDGSDGGGGGGGGNWKVFSGMTIAFTGALSLVRKEAVKLVVKYGGTFRTTVSAAVTHLVAADPNSGSSKLDKAEANGTKIVDADWFNDMVEKAKKLQKKK